MKFLYLSFMNETGSTGVTDFFEVSETEQWIGYISI